MLNILFDTAELERFFNFFVFAPLRSVMENNGQNMPEMPLKRGQNRALLKNFPRRPQIPQYITFNRNLLLMSVLPRYCAETLSKTRRKTAFCGSKSRIFPAVRASRGCNGAATTFQRGRRCNAKAAPLKPREALTARPAAGNRCHSHAGAF